MGAPGDPYRRDAENAEEAQRENLKLWLNSFLALSQTLAQETCRSYEPLLEQQKTGNPPQVDHASHKGVRQSECCDEARSNARVDYRLLCCRCCKNLCQLEQHQNLPNAALPRQTKTGGCHFNTVQCASEDPNWFETEQPCLLHRDRALRFHQFPVYLHLIT
jgi:hypothetical protein